MESVAKIPPFLELRSLFPSPLKKFSKTSKMFTCEHSPMLACKYRKQATRNADMSEQTTSKNRDIKVTRSFRNRRHPALRLSGRWLERAGFVIDTRVKIVVRDRCLVVLPADEFGD